MKQKRSRNVLLPLGSVLGVCKYNLCIVRLYSILEREIKIFSVLFLVLSIDIISVLYKPFSEDFFQFLDVFVLLVFNLNGFCLGLFAFRVDIQL